MKSILLIGIAVLWLTSCGHSQTQNQSQTQTQNTSSSTKTETVMKPIELTKADFLQKVANYETSPKEWKYLGDKPDLIDFYATWCGPCKMVAPILEELAAEYGDSIVIYKVDTDKEQELAAVFGIRSIPSLLFIPLNGTPQMAQGAMSKADFKRAIDQLLLNR